MQTKPNRKNALADYGMENLLVLTGQWAIETPWAPQMAISSGESVVMCAAAVAVAAQAEQ